MISEDYLKAQKIGLKQHRKAILQNENPHPVVLEELLKDVKVAGERELGVAEIPLSQVVGIKDLGRQSAFSPDFYPLLDEWTEFAGKWDKLFISQMDEGIRDAVKVYEYMNRFYVQEGNKRVSVMKYLQMPTILANVIRVSPERNESKESKKYYEYARFFELTHMYALLFSECGSYEKLLKILGKTWEEPWEDLEVKKFQAIFYRFEKNVKEINNQEMAPEKVGDLFLKYLTLFPYEEVREKSSYAIWEDLKSLKQEFVLDEGANEVQHILEPQETKQSLVNILLPPGKKVLKVAFIHDENQETSPWIYAHELGRLHVETIFGDEIETTVYQGVRNGKSAEAILEEVVNDGNKVIFTSTPKLMQPAMKLALKHPDVQIFNCSLNFPYKTVRTYYARMYEAKFLSGLIAGVLTETNQIAYEADYPIYGTVADINAFALGVQMVRPQASVNLYWSCLKNGVGAEAEENQAADGESAGGEAEVKGTCGQFAGGENEDMISAKAVLSSKGTEKPYGLYRMENGKIVRYATTLINWGKFYEYVINQMLKGTWKNTVAKDTKTINFWWGLSSGLTEVICSERVPVGTRRLINQFKESIALGQFHPFAGKIYDQAGICHGERNKVLPLEEIVKMDWLCENVVGSIPSIDELTPKAAELAEIQGV